MKKLISLALCIVCALAALSACGGEKKLIVDDSTKAQLNGTWYRYSQEDSTAYFVVFYESGYDEFTINTVGVNEAILDEPSTYKNADSLSKMGEDLIKHTVFSSYDLSYEGEISIVDTNNIIYKGKNFERYADSADPDYVLSRTYEVYSVENHLFTDEQILDALSKLKYEYSIFSINAGSLINKAVKNYKATCYTLREAMNKNYVKQTNNDLNKKMTYVAVVSGDVVMNPDIPYYTTYNDPALIALIEFNDNGSINRYNLVLCEDLESCALIIMSQY